MSSLPSTSSFLDAVAFRRSIYQLTDSSPVPDARLLDIVRHAARHVPSSFDSQTTRLVVLLGAEHHRFWDFVWDAVKPLLHGDADKEKASLGRINGFRAAKGSVLFFESAAACEAAAAKAGPYADKMPGWGEHTSAMHQYVLWTAFEAEGLGANLQHYNPLVDDRVIEHYKLGKDWALKAQLVFGGLPEGKSRDELVRNKDLSHRDEYVKVFGA